MVNCFLVYEAVCEEVSKTPMSHYNFQKSIAFAWIDPEHHGGESGYCTPKSDDSTFPLISKSSGSGKKRGNYVTTKSLCPNSGLLSGRLDHSLGHWPSLLPKDKHNNTPPCVNCADGLQTREFPPIQLTVKSM